MANPAPHPLADPGRGDIGDSRAADTAGPIGGSNSAGGPVVREASATPSWGWIGPKPQAKAKPALKPRPGKPVGCTSVEEWLAKGGEIPHFDPPGPPPEPFPYFPSFSVRRGAL